ncbi:MAG TPA: SDR family NAD(P)-dependent oxidoreductase [Intrasporangium sp.]|jgi:NAD(P)-dependent dehydrogenase (short-subunit alcohol dehydrogenase family)|uniref:SDR family NAD(P)-dependent oxidoreductase n=1 Tax=Intrasporangium sp. TaxID=1925024 RepID=UPI002F947279
MNPARTALITGASRGLGRALAGRLAEQGWHLLLTGRAADDLALAASELARTTEVIARAGDVADAAHRDELLAVVTGWGSLDLLVNNASTLGPTPLHRLEDLTAEALSRILAVNVVGPHALTRAMLPFLIRGGGVLLDLSSDAAVEHYETWGGYAASKAALDQLALTIGSELSGIRAYAFDPGDMRTAMHQEAFPGEDISDRPLPEEVAVPAILRLLARRPPSGRYRAEDLLAETAVEAPPEATSTASGGPA